MVTRYQHATDSQSEERETCRRFVRARWSPKRRENSMCVPSHRTRAKVSRKSYKFPTRDFTTTTTTTVPPIRITAITHGDPRLKSESISARDKSFCVEIPSRKPSESVKEMPTEFRKAKIQESDLLMKVDPARRDRRR